MAQLGFRRDGEDAPAVWCIGTVVADQQSGNVARFQVAEHIGPHCRAQPGIQAREWFIQQHGIGPVKDYELQLARLEALPKFVDGVIEAANEGLKRRLQAPKLTVDLMVKSLETQSSPTPDKSPLLDAFRSMPDSIPTAERTRLQARADAAYKTAFQPAWAKLRDYLTKTYAPATRDSIGMSGNFNGAEYYTLYVRSRTTTKLTPQEIHDIGQRELKRVLLEMADIRREVGFNGTANEFVDQVLQGKAMLFRSEAEILAHGRDIAKRIDPELPRLFKKLPRITYGVKAIPADRATTAAPLLRATRARWLQGRQLLLAHGES